MHKQLIHIFRQSVAAVMLLLFVGYYADINFFAHAHIINGVTIVHSHVHNQHHHDTKGGGHTTSEITLIAQLASQFLTTGETVEPLSHPAGTLSPTGARGEDAKAVSLHLTCPSLRAPPSLLFSREA